MKIKIHYTLYILLLISFFCNFIYYIVLMFLILSLHELGHLIFLKKYKREVSEIIFFPFGGIIKHSSSKNKSIKEDFYIESGGIIVNIILLFVFHIFNFQTCLIINYGILLFNSLPIYPLDGSKILKSFLSNFFPYKTSILFTVVISFISIITLLTMNILTIKSYYIFFLIIALINMNIKYISNIKKEYQFFLTNKFLYKNNDLKIKNIYRFNKPLNKLYLGKNNVFIIDDLSVTEEVLLKEYFS